MARVLVFAGLAAIVLGLFAIIDCALTERRRIRGLPRWAWIVVALVLPVVGPLLWLLIGRGPAVQRPATRIIGPDDDPEFLRSKRTPPKPAPQHDEARWAELEQELANLDPDADDEGEAGRR